MYDDPDEPLDAGAPDGGAVSSRGLSSPLQNGLDLLPSEVEELRLAIIADLQPSTVLEATYADDVADVTIDIRKKRRIRDANFLSLGRDLIWRRLRTTLANPGRDLEEQAQSLAQAWFDGDEATEGALAAIGLTTDHVNGQVHLAHAQYFHGLDLSIERLEVRRRRLLEELNRLKGTRRPGDDVEDAEVV